MKRKVSDWIMEGMVHKPNYNLILRCLCAVISEPTHEIRLCGPHIRTGTGRNQIMKLLNRFRIAATIIHPEGASGLYCLRQRVIKTPH